MQAPGTLNLTCYQGASFDRTLTWKIDGLAVNLTGYTARMQVRADYGAAVALNLASGTGITLGGAAGTIAVVITPVQTAALAAGNYVYDLELESSTGDVTRLVEGVFTVDPEVTR